MYVVDRDCTRALASRAARVVPGLPNVDNSPVSRSGDNVPETKPFSRCLRKCRETQQLDESLLPGAKELLNAKGWESQVGEFSINGGKATFLIGSVATMSIRYGLVPDPQTTESPSNDSQW